MSTTYLAQLQDHREPAQHLRQLLLRNDELRSARAADVLLAERIDALRHWRRMRISSLIPGGPAEQRAGSFLVEQLIAGVDFEARDAQLARAFGPLSRLARGSLLRAAADALELHISYQEFDHRVVQTVFDTMGELALTDTSIGAANRLINDYRQRMRQLELLRLVGKRLTALARSRSARAALATARVAARPFGTHLPLDAVAEGIETFAALEQPPVFMQAFVRGIAAALDRIHAGGDPFDYEADAVPHTDID